MLPAEIKFRLAIAEPKHYTQAAIALECEVANSMVWDVIHANRRNDRVANRIAVILKSTPAQLWPQVYGPNAKQRRQPAPMQQVVDALRARAG